VKASPKLFSTTGVELKSYSKQYENLLNLKVNELIRQWCGEMKSLQSNINQPNHALCFEVMQHFLRSHAYELDEAGCIYYERDAVLDANLIAPLRSCDLFLSIRSGRCVEKVMQELSKVGSVLESYQYLLQSNPFFHTV